MNQLVQSDELFVDPFIQFGVVHVTEEDLSEADHAKLASADAIIVFPDVTREATSQALKILRHQQRTRPIEITRFYPDGYVGRRESDFSLLPFTTPTHIVRYASEFLFRGTVRALLDCDVRLRLWRHLAWTACAALLLVGGLLTQSYMERLALERIVQQPEAIVVQENQNFLELRKPTTPPASRAFRQFLFLNNHVEVIQNNVTRVLENTGAKAVTLFARSADGQRLDTMATEGNKGYSVDVANSIAACAMLNDLIVGWTGSNGMTTQIAAWSRDGTEVGAFDKSQQTLHLPSGAVCRFDSKHRDGKTQLVCVPAGANRSGEAEGALCVSLDEPSLYAMRPVFGRYLLQQASPIAAVDLAQLVLDTAIFNTE
jgi:hypothetical protein